LSVAIGIGILLMTEIFTLSFFGNEVILSGIKGEKKMVDKTELEMRSEMEFVNDIKKEIKIISNRLEKIERKMDENENIQQVIISKKCLCFILKVQFIFSFFV